MITCHGKYVNILTAMEYTMECIIQKTKIKGHIVSD